jgi:hypothetical protein
MKHVFAICLTVFCTCALSRIGLQRYSAQKEEDFVRQTIRQELQYFRLAEHRSGLFVDHIHYGSDGSMSTGAYTAPSKIGFQIAVCLKVLAQEPGFEQGWFSESVPEARRRTSRSLETVLNLLDRFQREHPQLCGFVPWCELNSSGLVLDKEKSGATVSLPAIDQGILAFSLLATEWQLHKSDDPDQRTLANLARRVRERMNFAPFFDPLTGMMSGNLVISQDRCDVDRTYWLKGSFTESIIPVMYAVLFRQVPESAFEAISPELIDVVANGRHYKTFRCWRGSYHEVGIPMLFAPLQNGALSPPYRDYSRVHELHAIENELAGFVATAYGIDGQGGCRYLEAGVAAISASNDDHVIDSQAVFYANCLACLVDRRTGLKWVRRYLDQCPTGPAGAWESLQASGKHAPVYTTDAKAISVLALSGGICNQIRGYLSATPSVLGKGTMLDDYDSLLQRSSTEAARTSVYRPVGGHLAHPTHRSPSDGRSTVVLGPSHIQVVGGKVRLIHPTKWPDELHPSSSSHLLDRTGGRLIRESSLP